MRGTLQKQRALKYVLILDLFQHLDVLLGQPLAGTGSQPGAVRLVAIVQITVSRGHIVNAVIGVTGIDRGLEGRKISNILTVGAEHLIGDGYKGYITERANGHGDVDVGETTAGRLVLFEQLDRLMLAVHTLTPGAFCFCMASV